MHTHVLAIGPPSTGIRAAGSSRSPDGANADQSPSEEAAPGALLLSKSLLGASSEFSESPLLRSRFAPRAGTAEAAHSG